MPSAERQACHRISSFEKKSGQRRKSGNGQRGNQHGRKRNRNFARQPAHVAHVLLAAHSVNHGACAQEQQRLKESVSEDVKHARGKCTHTQCQEHIPQLGDSGVGQHALDVVLHQSNRSREE